LPVRIPFINRFDVGLTDRTFEIHARFDTRARVRWRGGAHISGHPCRFRLRCPRSGRLARHWGVTAPQVDAEDNIAGEADLLIER